MPEVNHEILRWARETAALSLGAASVTIDLYTAPGVSGRDRLAALEAGDAIPSRALLTRMAKQYRRPLITFYLSAPPGKGDRGQDFRTLSEKHSKTANALLDALLRDVMARQSLVKSLLVDEDEADPIPFVGSRRISDGVPAVLATIERAIPLTRERFRACRDAKEAFDTLRAAVEAAGVFVLMIGDLGSYHTALDVETFRGFAVADPIAPFIVMNDRGAKTAWSLTILHELAHLCLGQTGVSGAHARRKTEVFCTAVAGEFLLPSDELDLLAIPPLEDVEALSALISDFADQRNVSRTMVTCLLLKEGRIDAPTGGKLLTMCRDRWRRNRGRECEGQTAGGPDGRMDRGHRLGGALPGLVRRMLHSGALPTVTAARILGVKAKQVQPLLQASAPATATG
jgi:Zn-dependent peptidase ImmA (M78 family)